MRDAGVVPTTTATAHCMCRSRVWSDCHSIPSVLVAVCHRQELPKRETLDLPVCTYVCVCERACARAPVHTCACAREDYEPENTPCLCVYECMYVCMHICVCMRVCVSVCTRV